MAEIYRVEKGSEEWKSENTGVLQQDAYYGAA